MMSYDLLFESNGLKKTRKNVYIYNKFMHTALSSADESLLSCRPITGSMKLHIRQTTGTLLLPLEKATYTSS